MGIDCAEPNFIFLDIVVKKGIALMYIMLIANVISLYCSGMGIGLMIETGIVFFLVVFPLSMPISGPNMASAATMSFVEMGQFGSWLFVTIFMNFCVLVRPMALWILRAKIALE